jgi:hypothetical protein
LFHGEVKHLKAIQRRVCLFEWILACNIKAKSSTIFAKKAGSWIIFTIVSGDIVLTTGEVDRFSSFDGTVCCQSNQYCLEAIL